MAQNNTIGCWHASGLPHNAASICLKPLHEQIWKCCNLCRHLHRVTNHYTNKYGSAVIYAVNFTVSW